MVWVKILDIQKFRETMGFTEKKKLGETYDLPEAKYFDLRESGLIELTEGAKKAFARKKQSKEARVAGFRYIGLEPTSSEVEQVDFNSIYSKVGKRVCFKALVQNVLVGALIKEDDQISSRKKFLLTITDEREHSNERIVVQYVPKENDKKPFGIVEITGRVVGISSEKKTLKPAAIQVIASEIKMAKQAFQEYVPSPEEAEKINFHFTQINNENLVAVIDKTVAPHVIGRAWEKVANILVSLAPQQIPLYNNKEFLLTVGNFGDPRETKDDIMNDIHSMCPLGSVLINAETARKTGLVAGMEKDMQTGAWYIRWGKLAQADGAMAFISGISSFNEDSWKQMREVLAKRTVSVEGITSGTQRARCRIAISGNCRQPVYLFKNKYRAFLGTGTQNNLLFQDAPDALRIHIPIVYAREDVCESIVDNAATTKPYERLIPADVFRNKVALAWKRNLSTGFDLKSIEDLLPKMKGCLKKWREQYGDMYSSLAILGKEGIQVVCALVMSVAELKHRTDESGRISCVPEDVEFVRTFIDWLFKELGLNIELVEALDLKDRARETAHWIKEVQKSGEEEDFEKKENMKFYENLLRELYDKSLLTAEEVINRADIGRGTFFRRKSAAEYTLEKDFSLKDELIASRTGAGLWLTRFGVLVAKALEGELT